MRKLLAGVFLLALACGSARMAGAVIYPPGPPPGTCTDTLTIVDVENPAATCHPASGDTVYGITGIAIGFDKDVSPYNVYIEQASGAPWSGIAEFTGSTNYYQRSPWLGGPGIDLGDNLECYGRALEFNDLTEFTDFDNVQSTDDVIIRRLSRGNALPPIHVDTIHNLNWVPSLSAATAEPWESCLVKINQSGMKVGRNAGNGIGSRSFLVTCTSCGIDSAAVDGFSLTNVPAPTVGTSIDSIVGVLTQSTINSISSYRILLRSSDDLFAALPPSVTDAYPLEDNIIKVSFDRPVDPTTAQDVNNYSLGSFGSVNSATLEAGSRAVDLNVTNGLAHGDLESVSVSGIKSSSGITMQGLTTRTFVNGVLSLVEIQTPDPAFISGSPCEDRSRFVGATGASGTRLTYRGIDEFNQGSLVYLSDPVAGQRTGLTLFAPASPMTPGHKYEIAGQIQEFDGIGAVIVAGATEGVATIFQKDEGAVTAPGPQVETIKVLTDTTCDVNQNKLTGEDFEGVYVKIQHGEIVENQPAGHSFFMAYKLGPSATLDTILVNNNEPSFQPESLMTVDVTGGLAWRNTGTNRAFRLDDNSITSFGLAVGGMPTAKLSLAVSPNPSRTAHVTFAVPKKDIVDLGIYDLAGRRIVTLMKGEVAAGQYTKIWDGHDDSGRPVRAGMYFYRLKSGGSLLTTRAVKLD